MKRWFLAGALAFAAADHTLASDLPPPRAQARKVLYSAETALTCFAEVFQGARAIDRRRDDPWLARAWNWFAPYPCLT